MAGPREDQSGEKTPYGPSSADIASARDGLPAQATIGTAADRSASLTGEGDGSPVSGGNGVGPPAASPDCASQGAARAPHHAAHDHAFDPPPAYAALDLGTNNCRLLVARPSRRGFRVIDAFSRIIRLGEGVAANGHLSEAAIERTIDALRVCADKMHRHRVTRSRLVATQACRAASNSGHFLERVRSELGLDIEVLTPETEARLAVSGCASLIDTSSDLALVFDIGGGSSELIWLDLSRARHPWRRSLADRLEAQNCIVAWTSLPIGVVTLAERFGGRHVSTDSFEDMVRFVADGLAGFEAEHQFRRKMAGQRAHLLGTSGTVTTVAGIQLGLQRYDRNRVDGCWLDVADVRQVTEGLLSCSYEERIAEPCVGRDRADLVLAGCAILEALLRMWPCERLRVADRGLREGILAMLMAEDDVLRRDRRGPHTSRDHR